MAISQHHMLRLFISSRCVVGRSSQDGKFEYHPGDLRVVLGFVGCFSEYIASRGCRVDSASKAAAWHIAKVERRGDLWQAMWRRVVRAKQ
eukprot:5158253-Pyramimonas_sp.AAC.1